MDVDEIRRVGRGLRAYLKEFSDCFGRCDTESYLGVYVRGQQSDLQRKSAEPMALLAGIPPRSLQAFLGLLYWDEERMVNRLQEIVVRDHSHPFAIGLVDETGCPKKGRHTACVQRQWCGNTGKTDNCVTSVHLGYAAGRFHCLLDSDLFLPESWAADLERRRRVGIPEGATHRKKWQIGLAQIERALGNGIRVAAWTFDEGYGDSYAFLDTLDRWGQTYVGEVSSDFSGWASYPKILHRATPQDMRSGGGPRRWARLAKSAAPVSEVRHLLRWSPSFREQPWTPIHVKEGEAGPLVREVKAIRFWMHRKGLPTRAHWLLVARNPEEPDRVKYFVSNAPGGTPLEWLVYVAYSRWPIEQCFKEEKDELGFDHFEVRGWRAIHRHMYLTQVSHLYLNRMRSALVGSEREREAAGLFSPAGGRRRSAGLPGGQPDAEPGPGCPGGLVAGPAFRLAHAKTHPGNRGLANQLPAVQKHRSQSLSREENPPTTPGLGHRDRTNPHLCWK